MESGKAIVVTTLQKFPVIAKEVADLPGRRFAVIVDEAHSSQSGESTRSLKAVLGADADGGDDADDPDAVTWEDRINETQQSRGPQANLSLFAFTATPKPKTLELFGRRRADGQFEPFSLYSMRQAIEEKFILDVLAHYTTYATYWRLLKTIADDPHYDRGKASYLLKSFVDLHPTALDKKVAVMVEHFTSQVADRIDGRAKAMIVTRSRVHAVRYKQALDRHLAAKGYPYKALVAFSGKVTDGGGDFTESNMNGLPEAQTANTFALPEYRFLVVANKFQTGFDQPLLYAMYVDKTLGGVNAVQTLSRLNRTHADKKEAVVLDFVNDAASIQKDFQPYYETTLLSEATDPNLLYDLQHTIGDAGVCEDADLDAFARVYFAPKSTQDQLYAVLDPPRERYLALDEEPRALFRGALTDYVRLYAFLSQILSFSDAELEKLYLFARALRRRLPVSQEDLPREVQENIDMESYRVGRTGQGAISLTRGPGVIDPIRAAPAHVAPPSQLEPLSQIIAALNERFGTNLSDDDRVAIQRVKEKLEQDVALDASARVNPRDKARLTFDHKLQDVFQQLVDSNFQLYKRITDDGDFNRLLGDFLFDDYLRRHRQAEALIQAGESLTLEFKSTLRWNLREARQDDRITHAVLKTVAAFLNTEGGDLLIGIADDGTILGLDADAFANDDKFIQHLAQVVRNGLGDRAGTCLDARMQRVEDKAVCLVSCRRSPEPVFFKWKGMEAAPEGDYFVRSANGTVKLSPESAREYVRTRFA
ncbi:MAG: RNA-binding domain-containing protein [bacterium]